MIIDQGIFSCVIILLILKTYLLTVYGYCFEKFDLGHYWDLKGYVSSSLTVIKKKMGFEVFSALHRLAIKENWDSLLFSLPLWRDKD